MGVTAALSLGSAAMSAVGSISQGIAENKQAQQNAAIYEAQAQNIREAQKITAEQYHSYDNRRAGNTFPHPHLILQLTSDFLLSCRMLSRT